MIFLKVGQCYVKYRVMNRVENSRKIRTTAFNGIMLALIFALQSVNLPNILTGIVVNALLVFVSLYSGTASGIALCAMSPVGGIISGHMPPVMYPVLPVIAIGNMLLVICLKKTANINRWLRYFFSALVKAVFIGFIGWLTIVYCIPEKLETWVVLPVLGIQFITAITGCWLGEKLFQKIKK